MFAAHLSQIQVLARFTLEQERFREAPDYDFTTQMIAQSKAVLMTLVWSGVGSAILYKVVDLIVGLRVPVDAEREGLDITDHGERAYN